MQWWAIAVAMNLVISVACCTIVVLNRRALRRALEARTDPTVEELRARQRQALDIHDNVVQGLVMAKLSLELGEADAGMAALDRTLRSAQAFVTQLLAEEDVVDLRQAPLRRSTAAGPDRPQG